MALQAHTDAETHTVRSWTLSNERFWQLTGGKQLKKKKKKNTIFNLKIINQYLNYTYL